MSDDVSDWPTHCEDCGRELTPDTDWKDERYCGPCNVVYLHPDTEAEILRRLEDNKDAKLYTAAEVGQILGVDVPPVSSSQENPDA